MGRSCTVPYLLVADTLHAVQVHQMPSKHSKFNTLTDTGAKQVVLGGLPHL